MYNSARTLNSQSKWGVESPSQKKKKKIRHTLDRVQAHAASNEGDKNKKKEVSR